jgi:hypothetical protein
MEESIMPAMDPKKEKANIALVKVALRKAAVKARDGDPVRVAFAFAPGKDRKDHILLIDPRKKALQLLQEISKTHKDRKQLCSGTATVVKEGGKFTLSLKYIKKMTGAERKIQEALKSMALNQYKVVLEKMRDDEEVEDVKERDPKEDEEIEAHASSADEGEAPANDADDDAEEGEDEDGGKASGEGDEDEDTEEDDEEEEEEEDGGGEEAKAPAPAQAQSPGANAGKLTALGQAPQVWHQTRTVMSKNIDKLRAAIKTEYASEAPELNAEIDKGVAQMNRITERLDHRLAEQIQKAHQAKDDNSRKAELAKAKALLAEHIKYVQSEPLIAHIDSNPFGVETNLKKTLMASFTHMAKVIS